MNDSSTSLIKETDENGLTLIYLRWALPETSRTNALSKQAVGNNTILMATLLAPSMKTVPKPSKALINKIDCLIRPEPKPQWQYAYDFNGNLTR